MTGKATHIVAANQRSLHAVVFAPDGQTLATVGNREVYFWDVAAVRSTDRPATLDAASVRRAWDDLAADARKAFAARQRLAAAPDQAVPLLQERLKPVQPADAKRLRKLLAELDSDQFTVREKAGQGLAELGELAEPALRQALADKPSLEVCRRIQDLLAKLRAPVTRPETLRAWRAVTVLEDIASPAARRVLERLAGGAVEARPTREAKASLSRLDLRAPPSR